MLRWTTDADIIITTALIPGRPAPKLIGVDMVAGMRSGSVILDMAASSTGGNCALSGSASTEMLRQQVNHYH